MLEIKNLTISARQGNLVSNVSLCLQAQTILGLTGKSGAGKSTLVKTVMGMLDKGCSVTEGSILLDGDDLVTFSSSERRKLCGTRIGLIPQNPMTAFDPRRTLATQMCETYRIRLGMSQADAQEWAIQMLESTNLTDPKRVLSLYPDQLSGGMLQRCAVALVLGLQPQYLLADEPTSALDEVNRELLCEILQQASASMGILFISHDAQALKSLCEDIKIIESGKVIEEGSVETIFKEPQRLWTRRFVEASRPVTRGGWTWQES